MKDPAVFSFNNMDWKTPNTYDSENYSEVPNTSGVYILTFTSIKKNNVKYNILYVGSAKNLKQRYNRHEVKRVLSEIYGYIQFYFIEEVNYRDVEKHLIKLIQPKFNKQWR